ncbi:MAG: hypothetical protein ABI415_11350, partial [Flavitalea sp.]
PLQSLAAIDANKDIKSKMIAIQIGASSFMDEGVDKVLDTVQKLGGVNTIFLSTFCYDRGLNGRQLPGQPFPDHGIRESDEKFYYGGNYAIPHAKYYNKTAIKGDKMRAPDFGDVDVLAKIIPAAKKRGIKIYCSVLDSFDYPEEILRDQLKNFTEIDLYGEPRKTICFFRPDVREFWKAVVTDITSSYDIDGIVFFNERNGPLINAVGATHAESFSSNVTCFCDDHKKAAEAKGINFERAKEGYLKLDQYVKNTLKEKRPSDGYYVAFERLLLEYPEIIAYQQLFDFGKFRILDDVREAAKSAKPKIQVGFHIEHVNSWNPFYRASRNYEELAAKADFLKIVVYNNCAGERYQYFIRNIQSSIFRDVPHEELMRFNNHLLNYGNEASYESLPSAGFSPDYVLRETRRAMAGTKGKCLVLPGIDINIPTATGSRKASPKDTYDATMAGMQAGADGVILSRKYSEMMLANLEAAGNAIKDFSAGKGGVIK